VIGNVSEGSLALRDEHKAATRQRILRAVTELLAEEHPATLSIPAVAARANVSVPTIYRYFPTKEALLDAAATFGEELVMRGVKLDTLDLGSIDRWVHETWTQSFEILPLIEAQHLSPVGRDVRRRRTARRTAEVRTTLREHGFTPDSEAGRRLQALITLLISSSALIQLHDTQGLPLEAAVTDATWAIKQLLIATTREEEQSDAPEHDSQ
jgi:AcrR family transcriptional regulator